MILFESYSTVLVAITSTPVPHTSGHTTSPICTGGCTATKEELIEFVREGLSKFKAPRYVLLMDAFPMTASGKIQKFKLREMGVDLLGLHAAASIETA